MLNTVESNNNSLFKNLAKAFYETFKINKNELVQDMFENIIFESKRNLVQRSSDSYYNYYKGKDISSLTSKIVTFIDKDSFSTWLSDLLLSDNSNELLYKNMINNGFNNVTVENIVDDVTEIFAKIIESSGTQNNGSNIIDKLSVDEVKVEEILDNPIEDINKEFASKISKKIDCGSRVADSLLRDTYGDKVSQYYKMKPKMVGNNLKYFISAKNDETFKKLPVTTNIKFDMENCSEEERYNVTHFKEVLDNLDYNNKPIAFPPIIEVKKTIDSKIISNDLFEMNEMEGKLYMLPNQNIPKYKFTFKVFNKDACVEIKDLVLVAVHQPDRTIFTNNNRNKSEKYILDIIADNITEESMNLHYSFRLKQEYAEDLVAILDFYKINKLLNDKTASLRIINNCDNMAIISINNVGKLEYTEEQKEAMKRFISDFEKLIYIENYYNIKFKFDIDFMQKNLNAIEMVYASITNEDTFIYYPGMEFSFNYLGEEIKNMKPGDKMFFESDLDYIDLFDKHLELKNTMVRAAKAVIKHVDVKSKKIDLLLDCIEVVIDEKKPSI